MDDERKLANQVFWGWVYMVTIAVVFYQLGAYLNSCGVPA